MNHINKGYLVIIPHLLSVGFDKSLMHTRALILRQAGFLVDEAFNLKSALALVESDSIDAVILCHTLSKEEQRQLISALRKSRRLMPIICIAAETYDSPPEGCINTQSDAPKLLDAVGLAVYIPQIRRIRLQHSIFAN